MTDELLHKINTAPSPNDWTSNIKPSRTTCALHADPNKPLRDAHHTIRQLNDRIEELTKIYKEDQAEIKNLRRTIDSVQQARLVEERRLKDEIDTAITERNTYRSLILRILNIKD